MYCKFCGQELEDNCLFCPSCGKKVEKPAAVSENAYTLSAGSGFSPARIKPGFSDKINDPLIKAALKKNKKFTFIFAVILVLAPLAVTFVLSVKNDDFKNLAYGAVLSGIFLFSSLISAARKGTKKAWDGTVIDKRTETRNDSDSDGNTTTRTVYIVKFRKDNGRKTKLEESAYSHIYFDYLNVGDKVRYHPQFNCYYEKYDKSRDSYAICPVCQTKNDIASDTCSNCSVPIIK